MALDQLEPGSEIRRVDLHDSLGGRRQGGISPSRGSDNVFVFTEPAKGLLHGYLYDGWRDDELFHYTGEGQFGDQQMTQGNRAVRDHVAEGRELHVFEVRAGLAKYLGEFEYVDHHTADAPESGGGPIRSVIVFRLRPKSTPAQPPTPSAADLLGTDPVKEVPVEQHLTERMLIEPTRETYEAERREQKLVWSFLQDATSRGHQICRLQFRPTGEPAPIFCDLFDKTSHTIIEAKGSIARPSFRMAIGQLADYARLLDMPPSKAILVPHEPRDDLLRLASVEGISVIWPTEDGFVTTDSDGKVAPLTRSA